MNEVHIGQVTHFYNRICVAVLALTEPIRVGDTVRISGRTTEFSQKVNSLQIEHQAVEQAGPGQEVALLVDQRVRRGDNVFKVADQG